MPARHLLSALSQDLGLVLAQAEVIGPTGTKTNEIATVQTVLADFVWEGRLVTVDALLTQRAVAQAIREKGGTT